MTTESTSKAGAATEKKIAAKKPLTAAKKPVPGNETGKVVVKAVLAAKKAMPKQIDKKDKQKKVKMVRDSFSMTEGDYANLVELKKKCIAAGIPVKKSELLRVGLMGLMKLSNVSLLTAVKQIMVIKNTRPEKI